MTAEEHAMVAERHVKWKLDKEFPEGRAYPVDKHGLPFGPPVMRISGLDMHVHAFRVKDVPSTGEQIAFDADFTEEVRAAQVLVDGAVESTSLPGLRGQWIIVAYPHGD